MRGKGQKDTKKGWLERQNKQDGVDIREGKLRLKMCWWWWSGGRGEGLGASFSFGPDSVVLVQLWQGLQDANRPREKHMVRKQKSCVGLRTKF